MSETTRSLTTQELEMIDILRCDERQDFTLAVRFKEGRWFIDLHVPHLSPQRTEGEGATFSEAWDDLQPLWF
jgi:hypothetical protein